MKKIICCSLMLLILGVQSNYSYANTPNISQKEQKIILQQVDVEKGIRAIIAKSNPKLSEVETIQYISSIIKWSKHYSLPPLLVASVIHTESNFRKNCYSLGNSGPMQVNISAHKTRLKKMGIHPSELQTIEQGIHIGCDILKEYMVRAKGNIATALYRYNGAQNHKYEQKVLKMYNYGTKQIY